jgi:CO/xanthine dehydrogenase Mo-binding subunit
VPVQIEFHGPLAKYGGGQAPADGTVEALLRRFGMTDLSYVVVLADGRRCDLDEPLEEGATYIAMSPIGGGSAQPLRYIGTSVRRVDGPEKVTGAARYMTDLHFENACYARVKRVPHPHARIRKIETAKAQAMPGVLCVLTAKDIPGLNGFGIVVPDQPVLVAEGDKTRCYGDAVALVAAESEELAEAALELIEVDYEELPVVDDPLYAMLPGAPPVHEGGNIHLKTVVRRGDSAAAFAECDVIVEHTYYSPRQMHAFIETEGGWARQEEDGTITIWCPAQAAYRDLLQLSRIFALSGKKIREIGSPLGGAFGGKDELTVQHYLGLLAMKTNGRPVKLHYKREESVIAGMKRHPFIVYMKTGLKQDGTILANQVFAVGDTGAYASLGGPVINLAIEHCCGPYRVPNVDLQGYCVYTNNGIAGAFRGFGVNQVCSAIETNLDEAARILGIDPVELRRKNAYRRGDSAPIGHTLQTSVGIIPVLEAMARCDLWVNREQYRARPSAPWKKRGVGVASSMHGTGLGVGIPDYGAAGLEVHEDGSFTVFLAPQEIGAGNTTTYTMFAAEALGVPLEQIQVVQGDTGLVPDGGTVTASRSTYTGGKAILIAAGKLKELIRSLGVAGSELLDRLPGAGPAGGLAQAGGPGTAADPARVPAGGADLPDPAAMTDLYRRVWQALRAAGKKTRVEGYFMWPQADKNIEGVFGLPHHIYGYAGHVALVEVDTLTGETQVLKVAAIIECGRVINPQGLEAQAEGGAVMGMGYALMEDTVIEKGLFKTKNMSTYIIPTSADIPEVETIAVEEPEETGPFGAKGIGEVTMVPVVPAITNAIYDAVGARCYHLPATPERVFFAMRQAAAEEAARRQDGQSVAFYQYHPSDQMAERLRQVMAVAGSLQVEGPKGEGYAAPKGPGGH